MMTRTNLLSRIKAAVVGAAMIATTFVTPALSSVMTASADATEVAAGKLPYTLIADGVEDGKRQANFGLTKDQQTAKSLTITGSTTSKESGTIAVYGFGISKDPYWVDASKEVKSSGGKFTISVDIPTEAQGIATKVGIGIWYPKDNSEWVIESIKGSGSAAGPDTPVGPSGATTNNNKSGTSTFTDNKDGTATITATLSAQYAFSYDAEGNPVTQSDILLTQGTDEEDYSPYKDADGNTLPDWKEGDPINSQKFRFENFGIADMSTIQFQSFEYVIDGGDYDMSEIQYGGGINVKAQSDADTEYQKGKNGFWYNDQGAEDLEKYGDKFVFPIDEDPDSKSNGGIHSGYSSTGLGGYGKVVWDVPAMVQPYVINNPESTVGFQYWWGMDNTKEGTNAEGETQNYVEIPEIHLVSCTATYTRSMTVPYNKTMAGPKNVKLTSGDSEKLSLADLNLGDRDKVSAVLFHFKSSAELTQFVGGFGISVDEAKSGSSASGVTDGWYNPGNIAVINTNGEFDVMWILPEVIGSSVFAGDDGNVMVGYWYGDKNGDVVSDITVSSVEYYVYEAQEPDIVGDLKVPTEITLKVGETYDLGLSSIAGVAYESERPNVVAVDENGVLEALVEGLSTITVTTPEGQTAKITVVVEGTSTTTTAATTATTTTTTATTTTGVTTTVDPDTVIDWSRVLYGDVNVDSMVNLADISLLAKYQISKSLFPLTATGEENADCEYDQKIDMSDLTKLVGQQLGTYELEDLGPADKSKLPMYNK